MLEGARNTLTMRSELDVIVLGWVVFGESHGYHHLHLPTKAFEVLQFFFLVSQVLGMGMGQQSLVNLVRI